MSIFTGEGKKKPDNKKPFLFWLLSWLAPVVYLQ
jgi:hypothetical protein